MKSHLAISQKYNVDSWADVEFLVCPSQHRVPGLGEYGFKTIRRTCLIDFYFMKEQRLSGEESES